jgi:hypothetical protein
MTTITLLRENVIRQLVKDIPENLEKYRSGNFDYLSADFSNFIDTSFPIDLGELDKVDCSEDDTNEVKCCLAIYKALESISPYLARDERLWVYLTHTHLLAYARKRWPLPSDDARAVSHIKKHYFAAGARGIERDNAASRLWWMAAICKRIEGLDLERSLEVFLHQSDVRANIVERPTTSQNVLVLSAIVKKLDESYRSDKELYSREKFRNVMKELNLQGGIKLLEVLDGKEINKIVEKCTR